MLCFCLDFSQAKSDWLIDVDFDRFLIVSWYEMYSCFLSAKELMEIRAKKAHPRSLPSMPPKDFIPTHSAEETASINNMIEEKISFIKEERAERRYFIVDAKGFTLYSHEP